MNSIPSLSKTLRIFSCSEPSIVPFKPSSRRNALTIIMINFEMTWSQRDAELLSALSLCHLSTNSLDRYRGELTPHLARAEASAECSNTSLRRKEKILKDVTPSRGQRKRDDCKRAFTAPRDTLKKLKMRHMLRLRWLTDGIRDVDLSFSGGRIVRHENN
jgi:hypothetical protein